jgi:deoxycytidine triphosphate deaminase
MIMVDHQIREAVRAGTLGIENFVEEGIQPASYDMRIGDRLYSATASEPDRPINLGVNGHAYRIPPYGQVVLLTHETLRLPTNMVGRFGLTSKPYAQGALRLGWPTDRPRLRRQAVCHALEPDSRLSCRRILR